jgi:DNA repair protein RecO (recombination protein O)
MPPLKTEAIVIKTFDFRETSIIATLYTKDFGKINGILKGIKSSPVKFASTLEPFSHNEIVFYKKRNTALHLVSQCDLRDNFIYLRNNVTKFTLASLMMELLDAIMPPEEVNYDIFDLSTTCLKAMSDYLYVDKIATIFKIKLLSLSGFKPHLDSCISCSSRILGQGKFSVGLGGLICPQCFRKDLKARSIYRGTIATILHIEKSDLAGNLRLGINPQIKRELDSALASFIDFHIDKKLKSQNVLESLKLMEVKV